MVLKRRRILLIGRNFPLMAHSARLGAVSFLVTPRPFLFVDLLVAFFLALFVDFGERKRERFQIATTWL